MIFNFTNEGVLKLQQDKVIVLPFLSNTNIENAASKLNLAFKDAEENFPEDDDTDVYVEFSNELKNLISNIHGESQLIELFAQDEKILDKKYLTDGVNSIKQNCLKLTKTINNMIELRNFEKKQTCLLVNNANIVEIIDNIVINVSTYIKERIIFDTNIEEKFMPFDINKFQKAILIILSIAVRYSDKKGILVNLNVFENNITITVSFNNKNSELINFIKYKMDNLMPDNLDELSISLYLCKALIALHEGSISVVGNTHETIFTIELPCENTDSIYYLFMNVIKNEYLAEQIQIEFSDLYEI